VQSFLLKNFLLEFLRINVSLDYSSIYYVILSCVHRYNNFLLYVCTQSYIFDIIFNYLKHLKKIIRINIYFSTNIVIKTCNKVSIKFAKYYLKTKELDDTLYNLVNILNFTQKVNLYKL